MNELVSIITPSYNSSVFIQRAINSVLNQEYQNWELLITDDCSTDDTVSIINTYEERDPRIKLFELESNGGPGVARNNSISNAQGRFIAFLDSDDKWYPTKLTEHLDFMEKKNASLSFTSYDSYNENEHYLKTVTAKKEVRMKDMLKSNYIGCSTAIYDQLSLGKIYMPEIRKRQDYGLWIDILKKTQVAYGFDKPLTSYLVRENSVSSNKMNLIKYQWKFYRDVVGLSRAGSLRSTFYWFFYSVLGIKNKGK